MESCAWPVLASACSSLPALLIARGQHAFPLPADVGHVHGRQAPPNSCLYHWYCYEAARTGVGRSAQLAGLDSWIGWGCLCSNGRVLVLQSAAMVRQRAALGSCTGLRVAFIQRSCGYALRPTLSIREIREAVAVVKRASPRVVVVVDNCYGEFTEASEPCEVINACASAELSLACPPGILCWVLHATVRLLLS